jgi:hypothetical protein
VGAHGAADVGVQAVDDVAVSAQLAEALGDERVDRVGQPGSEVVFDLVIESAHHPAQQRHPTVDGDRRAQLVQLDVVAPTGLVGPGELGAVNAVGELEANGEGETDDPGADQIERRDGPPRMEQQRDRQRPGSQANCGRSSVGSSSGAPAAPTTPTSAIASTVALATSSESSNWLLTSWPGDALNPVEEFGASGARPLPRKGRRGELSTFDPPIAA